MYAYYCRYRAKRVVLIYPQSEKVRVLQEDGWKIGGKEIVSAYLLPWQMDGEMQVDGFQVDGLINEINEIIENA